MMVLSCAVSEQNYRKAIELAQRRFRKEGHLRAARILGGIAALSLVSAAKAFEVVWSRARGQQATDLAWLGGFLVVFISALGIAVLYSRATVIRLRIRDAG